LAQAFGKSATLAFTVRQAMNRREAHRTEHEGFLVAAISDDFMIAEV
jgi:hypothetical protein